MVSVWAGGAGGRAWVRLGGQLGPTVGTDFQSQGDCQVGGRGGAELNRSLMEVWRQCPGDLSMDRVLLKALA